MRFTKQELEDLYWRQKKSAQQIAKLYACRVGNVLYAMRKLNIPRRTLSSAVLNAKSKCQDREQLNRLYWQESKSTYDIAKILGTSRPAVIDALRRFNIPLRTQEERQQLAKPKLSAKRGEACGKAWKGGRIKQTSGYIKVKAEGHPYADRWGYVLEHRLVMERKIGRYLHPWERVHHIDGQKDNNEENNLELVSPANHALYTRMCAHCELRKRVKLLEWHIKDLRQQLQYKLENFEKDGYETVKR